MMKRSFFLALAAGLLVSLSLTASSQAGSTLVTTDTSFAITAPAGTTVTDLEVTYTPSVDPITNLMVVSSTGLTGVSISESANTVTVTFDATTSGSVVFTFETNTAGPIGSTSLAPTFSGASNHIQTATTSLNVTSAPVGTTPEPSSIALLGIGMTGFLAFRRLFKRPSVA